MGALRPKIDALFDYEGDIANNKGASTSVYSSTYSPNNIRRVVISPNGVLVVYHKSCSGTKSKSYSYIEFSERDLYFEESNPKYKPILRMLAVPLVCASVEEIVVLRNALSGMANSSYISEIELSSLVATFKGEGSDLKERISNRFKRLRYYTVMDINFKEFLGYFKAAIQTGELKKYSFFSDMPGLKPRSTITELADEEYWRYYGCQTGSYAFDLQLREHFESIKMKREAEKKSAAINAERDKRVGGKVKSINDMIEDYLTYSKLWSSYYIIIQKEGTNGVLPDLSFVHPPETVQLLPFKGMVKVPDIMLSKQPCSEAEAFEKDEAMLKNYKAKCCKALAIDFLTALGKIQGEPYLLKTFVKDCETTICVPIEMNGVAASIASVTGVEFSGKDVQASVVNCCWQFMQGFVNCEHTEPFTRRYWESKIARRVAKS